MDVRRQRRERDHRRRRRTGLVRLTAFVTLVGGVVVALVMVLGGAPGTTRAAASSPAESDAQISSRRAASSAPALLSRPARLPARTVSVPILMYHRIDRITPALPAITQRLTVDPTEFATEMRWLAGHGFHSITQLELFDALERGGSLPSKPVLITFDDGYRDVFSKAMPVLRRLHLRATAYVITGRISGPDPSFLTWGMLAGLERRGIEIGSHTVHHLELPVLSNAQAMDELVNSRHDLERHLGHPVQWFAYPAGAEDPRTVALVRQAGYVLAVTTHAGSVQDARAPLELHRYEVLDSTGVAGLASLLGS